MSNRSNGLPKISPTRKLPQMPLLRIESLDDPRLEPYRHLRMRNLTQYSGRFIAESRLLVERLLRSDYLVESILVDENQQHLLPVVPEEVEVYLMPGDLISELLGFDFHRGVLACGRRRRLFDLNRWKSEQPLHAAWTGVMMVGIQDPENMGLIVRTCSALGIRDLFIGPNCVDPFARRVLRVSMAGLFNLQLISVPNVLLAIDELASQAVRCVATSLDDRSIPLESFRRQGPTLILLGNEANGLPEAVLKRVSDAVRIDMCLGTDSLNVSIAAGIVLHYVTRMA
jgi:tRNA G18 (ribose-2'-O)-methylase SpoU